MVAQLREKADDAAIPVVLGDMATTVAAGNYSLVYLVFNTISNLLTQAEQVSCFRNAARHLVPGGRFVIELSVPDLRKLPPGQKAVVWQAEPGYIGLDTYDVVVSHHFKFGEGRQSRVFRTPHRYIWPAELDLMAQLAGFELESRHADWVGSEFTAESRSHVSVYRIPLDRQPKDKKLARLRSNLRPGTRAKRIIASQKRRAIIGIPGKSLAATRSHAFVQA